MNAGIYKKGKFEFVCEPVLHGKMRIIAGGKVRQGHVGQVLCKPIHCKPLLCQHSGLMIIDGAYFEDVDQFEKAFEFKGQN